MKPTLILVGADKGGVGKTTISRAMLDFLARRNILARAFDTEHPRGTLHRFYNDVAPVIDLTAVADQMRVLDTLQTANVKVTLVDLKAGNLSYAMEVFERIGVLEAARAGEFNFSLMHVLGPSIASLEEISEVSKYMRGLDWVLVKNFINETNFFEWDKATRKRYFGGEENRSEISIPKLNEMAYEQVDLAGVTFRDFIENKQANGQAGNFSFVLRGYVRKWCSEIDVEFERLKLVQGLINQGRNQPAQAPATKVANSA